MFVENNNCTSTMHLCNMNHWILRGPCPAFNIFGSSFLNFCITALWLSTFWREVISLDFVFVNLLLSPLKHEDKKVTDEFRGMLNSMGKYALAFMSYSSRTRHFLRRLWCEFALALHKYLEFIWPWNFFLSVFIFVTARFCAYIGKKMCCYLEIFPIHGVISFGFYSSSYQSSTTR